METLFNYFWLVAIVINGINTVIVWRRVQPYIQKKPNLRTGYSRMLKGYFLWMSVPWMIMGIGLINGGVSQIEDYFYPRTGNLWVIAWWISIWILSLRFSYWIWFQGGAERLIEYPGFLRVNPGNLKMIRWMCIPTLVSSALVSGIMMFSEKQ